MDKTLQWDATLTGTYGERNKLWKYRNWKWRSVLSQRKIVHHQILLGLLQEHLDASFQFFRTKSHVVLGIGTPWSW